MNDDTEPKSFRGGDPIRDAYRGLDDYLAVREQPFDVASGLARFMVEMADRTEVVAHRDALPVRTEPRLVAAGRWWRQPILGFVVSGVLLVAAVTAGVLLLPRPLSGSVLVEVLAGVAFLVPLIIVWHWRRIRGATRESAAERSPYRRGRAVREARVLAGRTRVALRRTSGSIAVRLAVVGLVTSTSLMGNSEPLTTVAVLLGLVLIGYGALAGISVLSTDPERRHQALRVLQLLLDRREPGQLVRPQVEQAEEHTAQVHG